MNFVTPAVVAPLATRIRAEFNGKSAADSRNALLLRESPFKISYFFPERDVNEVLIERESARTVSRKRGKLTTWTVSDGQKIAREAAFAYSEPAEEIAALRGYIALDFASMDRWLEEDEELLGHPRDPYTRIDVRRGSQHVEVALSGKTIIDSKSPLLLTETGLPLRYYIPKGDIDWTSFKESTTESVCPYKGRARYFTAAVGDSEIADAIWYYPSPLQDAALVTDAYGLYHEKLEMRVDGRPVENWPIYFTK